jgi:aryl-alcohol dehydrogenase-like predicted oxidoreductase
VTAIPVRPIPRTHAVVSAVICAVDPPPVTTPSVDDRIVALLRRARERGVITYDVAAARFPARAERLVAKAFPSDDPELSTIVGRSHETLARDQAARDPLDGHGEFSEVLEESLAQTRHRLSPVRVSVVEWDGGSGGESEAAPEVVRDALKRVTDSEETWAFRLRTPARAPDRGESSHLYSGDLSLLEPGLSHHWPPRGAPSDPALFARDPFAGGRLDGSRFESAYGPRDPGAPPPDLRRMHTEFDPVLRLGFLTEGRGRTLAQAALWFVLSFPWVLATVVPLPAPERLDEVLGYASRPPLTSKEFAQLERMK